MSRQSPDFPATLSTVRSEAITYNLLSPPALMIEFIMASMSSFRRVVSLKVNSAESSGLLLSEDLLTRTCFSHCTGVPA